MPRRRKSSTGQRRKYQRPRYTPAPVSSHSENESNADVNPLDVAFLEDPTLLDAGISERPNYSAYVDAATETDDLQDCFVGNFDVLSEYDTLREGLKTSVKPPYIFNPGAEYITILQLNEHSGRSAIKLKLIIQENFVGQLFVHNQEVTHDHDIWDNLTTLNRQEHVCILLQRLSRYCVCVGNPDPEYTALTPIGTALSDNKTTRLLAFHEGDFCVSQGSLTFASTIRSTRCALLVPGIRCQGCSEYRRCLRKRKRRLDDLQSEERNYVSSTYKHCDMPREILIKKICQQKSHIKTLEQEVERLKRDLRKEIKDQGVTISEQDSVELKDLMSTCSGEVEKAFPDPNCLQRLFWEQQLKYEQAGKFGMRWHPMIIRWCLYLRHKSAKAYDAVRDAGFVKLPSNRTLFDYSHFVSSKLGFQPDVLRMLHEEAKKQGMFDGDVHSYTGILFDEIRIKEDLVYDKHSGELIGYCNLDSIGNTMMDLEQSLKDRTPSIAKYVLVLMVRGIVTRLRFPLAAFATANITGDFLYPIIWKAIGLLETQLKLKVLFLTCDGASANRRFYNLHRVENTDLVYFTVNPHDRSRNIYFVSDVPHLLKTTRNCFSNSFSHRNTRRLWRNGKDISWMHLVSLFESHCEMELYNPCHKLTRQHIDLTAFSYMKVNVAAQVLSDTVANALEDLYDDRVSETVTFIRNFNKFFDLLNVRSQYEGRYSRNSNLNPYSVDDERLTWLTKHFLGYIDSWCTEVAQREGPFSSKDRASMVLSHQTITGLQMTVHSITNCVKFMLGQGAKFVLTHAFNQDPLEQHFGHYRHKGGANKNPSVNDVRNMMTTIRTVGVHALVPKHGNTQDLDENIVDDSKLPRRK